MPAMKDPRGSVMGDAKVKGSAPAKKTAKTSKKK